MPGPYSALLQLSSAMVVVEAQSEVAVTPGHSRLPLRGGARPAGAVDQPVAHLGHVAVELLPSWGRGSAGPTHVQQAQIEGESGGGPILRIVDADPLEQLA